MKILIDATPLLKDWSGIGYVTFRYAQELKKLERDTYFYYSWFYSKELKERPLKNYEKIVNLAKRIIPRPYLLTYGVKSFLFNFILLKEKPDVVIQPNYISFNTSIDVPIITFIHDLSHIRYKKYHPKERVDFFEKNLKKSIDRSKKIVTISKFTKKELIELKLCEPDKIEVIPNGVDKKFSPISKKEFEEIKKKYKIDYKNYFLFVGTLEPRKNIQTLLKAYLHYLKLTNNPLPLILIGGRGWKDSYFSSLLDKAIGSGYVRYLGYIKENELIKFYGGARGFIFPSFYEGFGLPPLEAMACGTPVIASNVSSIPEVVEDAGMLISPYEVEGFSYALKKLEEDEEFCLHLSKKGLLQAKKFSWESSAKELFDLALNVAKD